MARWTELGSYGFDRRAILIIGDWQAIVQENDDAARSPKRWLWKVRGPNSATAGGADTIQEAQRAAEAVMPPHLFAT